MQFVSRIVYPFPINVYVSVESNSFDGLKGLQSTIFPGCLTVLKMGLNLEEPYLDNNCGKPYNYNNYNTLMFLFLIIQNKPDLYEENR